MPFHHPWSDADAALDSRARLAAIVDSSDDAIISKTLEGVIVSWNAAAERIFGWSPAEAVGRHITLIIPPERRAEEEGVFARVRRGERVDHFETVRVAKDGRRVDVSVTVSPVRDAVGRIIGASKIGRDISDRRRLEEARFRALEREQEARREAEQLSRAKDELLATVSHELRTPLNAIFGWARMLQSGDMDEAQRARAVNAIVRSASAQTRLVEDLLDLSRIVTGRLRLDFEVVDLGVVIEAALEAVRPAASAKQVQIATALDRGLGTIVGAPDRLQQVIWNLAMNAVKFTPRGGRIEVAATRTGDTVTLVVADTGEGIAPAVLPHVFEAFWQEDASSTRAHGGLGLGLALVRQLVELHGGRVRAESAGKGRGSTFTVTLPAGAPRADADPAARPADGPRTSPAPLGGVRILVVDDDSESLDICATILREAGAEVRTASSAFAALEAADAWPPEVVLSDLAMPAEDGFMLLRAMRAGFARRGADVRGIAVTADDSPENRRRAEQSGFDVYLTKPIDPIALARVVADVARRAAGPAGVRKASAADGSSHGAA